MNNSAGPGVQRKRRHGSGPWSLILAAMLLATVSGCAPSGEGPSNAAQAFRTALVRHDLDAACAFLAPATVQSVAKDGGRSCPSGLEHAAFVADGSPSATEVFGRSALVTFGEENVFLTQSGSRWLVDAAGCTAVEDGPFDCAIGGV